LGFSVHEKPRSGLSTGLMNPTGCVVVVDPRRHPDAVWVLAADRRAGLLEHHEPDFV